MVHILICKEKSETVCSYPCTTSMWLLRCQHPSDDSCDCAETDFSKSNCSLVLNTPLDSQVYFLLLPKTRNESQLGSVLVVQAAVVGHDRTYQGALELRGQLGHGRRCAVRETKGKHKILHWRNREWDRQIGWQPEAGILSRIARPGNWGKPLCMTWHRWEPNLLPLKTAFAFSIAHGNIQAN